MFTHCLHQTDAVFTPKNHSQTNVNQSIMASFKTCIRKKRTDDLYPVYIRVTHHRKPGYIKTEKVVDKTGIRKKEVKDPEILSYCTNLIKCF